MTYDKSVCLSYTERRMILLRIIISRVIYFSEAFRRPAEPETIPNTTTTTTTTTTTFQFPSLISWYVRISPNHGRILSPYHFGCHHFYTKCQRPTPSVDWRFNHDAQLGPFGKKNKYIRPLYTHHSGIIIIVLHSAGPRQVGQSLVEIRGGGLKIPNVPKKLFWFIPIVNHAQTIYFGLLITLPPLTTVVRKDLQLASPIFHTEPKPKRRK